MAVEVAIVAPIVLVVMVIVVDMLVFAGECARFDHVASQAILASTTVGGDFEQDSGDRTSAILPALEDEFARNGSFVTVDCSDANQAMASMVIYSCEFRFAPWPLSIPGAPPLLTHTYKLAVDPYVPGALL